MSLFARKIKGIKQRIKPEADTGSSVTSVAVTSVHPKVLPRLPGQWRHPVHDAVTKVYLSYGVVLLIVYQIKLVPYMDESSKQADDSLRSSYQTFGIEVVRVYIYHAYIYDFLYQHVLTSLQDLDIEKSNIHAHGQSET